MQNSQCLKVVAPRKSYAMKKGGEDGKDTTACHQLWDKSVREPACPLTIK
jgi:hypothetical protein